MATSIACGYALWMDGSTLNGLLGRTQHIAASFLNAPGAVVRGGVLASGGQMAVTAGSGMSVNVATGYALCPSSAGSSNGAYLFGLLTAGSLTVATADATNPRVDLIAAWVSDTGNSSDFAGVSILTGTPAAGATLGNMDGAQAVPANGVAVGYVLVPAGAASILSADVQSRPAVTVAQGGILPVTIGFQPAGYTGAYLHDKASGRFMHNPASGPVQPLLLPVQPVAESNAEAAWTGSGTGVTICSAAVTTDGNTDLEINACWGGYLNADPGSSPWQGQLSVLLDGTVLKTVATDNAVGAGLLSGGGSLFHVTQSGTDRPSAAPHTVSLVYFDATAVSAHHTLIFSSLLYVRAAPL